MAARDQAEIAARVVAALIDMAERRAQLIPLLSLTVARAVDELDPDHTRNSEPTWWHDLPPWQRLDSFDRLRRAHDQLKVLEVQAEIVVQDLKGMFRLAAVGSTHRPVGYTPARAHAELMRMALRRREILADMAKSEKVLHSRLSATTSAALRAALRTMRSEETAADAQRVRLTELLSAPTDLRQSC